MTASQAERHQGDDIAVYSSNEIDHLQILKECCGSQQPAVDEETHTICDDSEICHYAQRVFSNQLNPSKVKLQMIWTYQPEGIENGMREYPFFWVEPVWLWKMYISLVNESLSGTQ